MNRRGFLQGILAAGCAPAIVRVDSLMKIIVPSKEIILPSQQLWAVDQIGGYFYSLNLADELRKTIRLQGINFNWQVTS